MKTAFYNVDFSGDLSRAFKRERTYREHTGGFQFIRTRGDYTWATNSSMRWSDDPTVQSTHVRDWQLLSLVSSLSYKDRWDLTFGNILPNYHRYALSTSLEGLIGNYRTDIGPLKLAASATTGRSARGTDSRYTRWVSGSNLALSNAAAWGALERASLSVSTSIVHDDRATSGIRNGLVDARAVAAKIETRFRGGWNAEADYGFSAGQTDVLAATRHQTGGAAALRVGYQRPNRTVGRSVLMKVLPVAWQGNYEVVSDDYFAPAASAGADLKRWSSNMDHVFAEWLGFTWNLNRLEDNSKDRRLHTNYTMGQNYRVNLSPFLAPVLSKFALREPLELSKLKLTLDFRRTARAATNLAANTKTEDYNIGLGHEIRKFNLGAQYSWQLVDNDLAAASDRKMERWSVNAGRAWTFEPIGLTMQLNGGFNKGSDWLRNFSQVTRNQNTNVGASMNWRDISASADWSRARLKRFPFGTGSHTNNTRASLGWIPSHYSDIGLEFKLSGTIQDIEEDVATRNFRSREIRGDAGWRF